MPSSGCVFSTTAALHRVFIAPIEQRQVQFLRVNFPAPISSTAPRLLLQKRWYASPPEAAKRRLPRDDEIKSWTVTLVDEEGKLQEPQSTYDILNSIDRKEESLVVMAPGEPGIPPICKIIKKKAEQAAEKARLKASRSHAAITKTIELNWAIDGNDLGHRLKKMKEFLAKGYKVEVIMAEKRRGRRATPDEALSLVKKVQEAFGAVEGAKEMKPMEGKLLANAILFGEGRPQK